MSSSTPRDGQRPPLASVAGSVVADQYPSPTSSPAPHSILKHTSITPPSPSSAPAFTPTAASVSAALWAYRNPSAPPSVIGSDGPLRLPTPSAPQVAGTTPIRSPAVAAASAAAPTTTTPALITTSEDVLRGIYNEKLHASVRTIITTLSTELPADHIFLQLLADPTTLQYCKVRLAEVVEGFLYSTQAEQYHELATELARREQDCDTQRHRIEELELALANAVAEAQQQQQQKRYSQERSPDGDTASHLSRSPPLPPPSTLSATPHGVSTPIADAAAAGNSISGTYGEHQEANPAKPVNPMDDEEARRELLRVLEQATHDQELSRCRQALQAVSKVVAVATAAGANNEDDKYAYEDDVVNELYSCVHSLLLYVDGALESQERLRREVQEQQQHPWQLQRGGDATAMTAAISTSGGGGLVSSAYSTPLRPHAPVGNNVNASVMDSAVSSHRSAPPVGEPQGVAEIRLRRAELQRLLTQLRSGHAQSREVLEQLAVQETQRRREVAQLRRAVEVARGEAAEATTSAEATQLAKENVERLRAEAAASAAAEHTELRDQLADVHAQLAVARQDLQDSRREAATLAARVADAEKREASLAAEVDAASVAMRAKETQLRERQTELKACQVALAEVKAAHMADLEAQQDAARELLCLRVEKAMAGLSALYQESKAAKAELLERHGYRHVCYAYSTHAAAQQEAQRHALAQLHVAQTAELERMVAQQAAVDALGVLLRSMWADDATEAVLRTTSPHSSELRGEETHTASATPSSPTAAVAATQEGEDGVHETELKDGESRTASALSDAAAAPAQRYRLPTTLSGLCAALECAYANVRARHRARQKTVDALRTTLIGKDIELRAAQANDAQLRELLKAERSKEEQWRAEMAQLSDHNPMRDLLARQDALLKAVSDERNALRKQWSSLSDEYIALEQRNGVLHARCAEKEHENARLNGMLLRGTGSASSTPRPAAPKTKLPPNSTETRAGPTSTSAAAAVAQAAARTLRVLDEQNGTTGSVTSATGTEVRSGGGRPLFPENASRSGSTNSFSQTG